MKLTPLALAAILAPSIGQEPEAPPSALETLTDGAARIVLGRVESLRECHQSRPGIDRDLWPDPKLPLARVAVEKGILGAEEALFVFAGELGSGSKLPVLEVGQRLLLFLELPGDLVRPSSRETRRRLRRLTEDAGLFVIMQHGRWPCVETGRIAVPAEVDPLPEGLVPKAGVLERGALFEWLSQRLDASCPTLQAGVATSGLFRWNLEVDHGGRWALNEGYMEPDISRGTMKADEQAALWNAVEEARYFDLPETVGEGRYVGDSILWLRIRGRERGLHYVRLLCTETDHLEDREERARVERALAIWEVLPGSSSIFELRR